MRPGLAGLLVRRVLGGMVATPWFAVGTGLVVAAWMALASHGAEFTFPSSPQATCRVGQCPSGPDEGGTATAGPGAGVGGGGPRPLARPAPGGVAGSSTSRLVVTAPQAHVRVEYSVQRSGHHFVAVFEVIGKRDLGTWTLRLAIPGAHINMIMGARWNRISPGTGIVSGTPPPWQQSGTNAARFVIMGTDWQGEPWGCQYDGQPCAFFPAAAR